MNKTTAIRKHLGARALTIQTGKAQQDKLLTKYRDDILHEYALSLNPELKAKVRLASAQKKHEEDEALAKIVAEHPDESADIIATELESVLTHDTRHLADFQADDADIASVARTDDDATPARHSVSTEAPRHRRHRGFADDLSAVAEEESMDRYRDLIRRNIGSVRMRDVVAQLPRNTGAVRPRDLDTQGRSVYSRYLRESRASGRPLAERRRSAFALATSARALPAHQLPRIQQPQLPMGPHISPAEMAEILRQASDLSLIHI